MAKWKVEPYDNNDKRVTVVGPNEIVLYVDNDDVEPYVNKQMIDQMVRVLNLVDDSFWDEKEIKRPDYLDCECVVLDGKRVEKCNGKDCEYKP